MGSKPLLTATVRVRNEEYFVRQAIESVLPAVDKVLVFDTGSTDRTLEKIGQINDPRIELVHKPPTDAAGLAKYRNEMADRVTTEWFWNVDGDEVYLPASVKRLREFLQSVPEHVHRIALHRRHFYGSLNFIGKYDSGGRIYRASRMRIRLFDPKYHGEVGHETPYDTGNPDALPTEYSMIGPEEIYLLHLHYLPRSPKDLELGRMRSWRVPPFPLKIYLGPWPDGLELNGKSPDKSPSLRLYMRWIAVNIRAAWLRGCNLAEKASNKVVKRNKS